MNSNYNYSDFSGIRLTANNESQHYDKQLDLQPVTTESVRPQDEQYENMLFSDSRYYKYCE
jgi:hypothetical protein